MNIEKWEQQLKVLAQLAGACVAAAYIGGFLVVSGYHAKYGILGISFVRPKILTAGVVFFVFLAIPIYELGLIYGWPVFLNALKSQLTTDTVTTPVSTRNQIISRSDRLATGIGHLLTYVA